MRNPYKQMGIRRVINAATRLTRLEGSILNPEEDDPNHRQYLLRPLAVIPSSAWFSIMYLSPVMRGASTRRAVATL